MESPNLAQIFGDLTLKFLGLRVEAANLIQIFFKRFLMTGINKVSKKVPLMTSLLGNLSKKMIKNRIIFGI